MLPRRRFILVLAALAVALALSAAPVAAGGAATAEITAGLDEPPVAGEDREIQVLLLQHGVTPVDFGEVTLTATLPGTGERVIAEASSTGAGTWTATIAFPSAGDWQLQVAHNDLATPAATPVTVAESGLALPPIVAPILAIALLGLALALAISIARRARPTTAGPAPAEAPAPRI